MSLIASLGSLVGVTSNESRKLLWGVETILIRRKKERSERRLFHRWISVDLQAGDRLNFEDFHQS